MSLDLSEQFCYLTTVGRRTGKAHTIEIWFAAEPGSSTIYMLAGGGHDSDWVRNIGTNPAVMLRIGSRTFEGRGRIVQDPREELQARKLVVAKYYGRDELNASGWDVESLPVAIDLEAIDLDNSKSE